MYDDAQAGNHDALGTHKVEALAFYQSIQPEVAQASAAADETIMAYLESETDGRYHGRVSGCGPGSPERGCVGAASDAG